MLAAMDAIAADSGASHAAIALAWLRNQPGIPAPIASATRVEQLAQLIESTRLELRADQLAVLTAACSTHRLHKAAQAYSATASQQQAAS